MRRDALQDDIPDFLLNSPYLPVYDGRYDAPRGPQKPASIFDLLRPRRPRSVITWTVRIAILLILFSITRSFIVRRWFSGPRCLFSEPITPPTSYLEREDIDWSRYAYAQYVTNADYLCNSLMIFETLHRLGSKADRLMLYPSNFNLTSEDFSGRLLLQARDKYGAKLVPIEVQHRWNAYRKPPAPISVRGRIMTY